MTRHNTSMADLDAQSEQLSQMYREKFQAAQSHNKPLSPEVVQQFAAKHRELAVAYGTLPRSNGKPRQNKMPPDAIIITSQLADDVKAGRFGPPPYFRPRDVPPMALALIKKLVYAQEKAAKPEARASAKKALQSLLEMGVIPPQGIESMHLFDNSFNLVRTNGDQAMDEFHSGYVRPRRASRRTRSNTHLSSMQDKLGYIDAFLMTREFMNNLEHVASAHNERPGGYDVDGYYNEIERRLKTFGLHDIVESLRRHLKERGSGHPNT